MIDSHPICLVIIQWPEQSSFGRAELVGDMQAGWVRVVFLFWEAKKTRLASFGNNEIRHREVQF